MESYRTNRTENSENKSPSFLIPTTSPINPSHLHLERSQQIWNGRTKGRLFRNGLVTRTRVWMLQEQGQYGPRPARSSLTIVPCTWIRFSSFLSYYRTVALGIDVCPPNGRNILLSTVTCFYLKGSIWIRIGCLEVRRKKY